MKYVVVMLVVLLATNAWAIDTTHLSNPALQSRYESLTRNFRCLVCQDEDIFTSNAELAVQLRNKVRDMLVAGKTNQDIIAYMVDRYGQFVLYKPPVQPNTWLLWFGPFLLLIFALGVVIRVARQRSIMTSDSDEEPPRR